MDSFPLFLGSSNMRFGPSRRGGPSAGPSSGPGRRPRPGSPAPLPVDDFSSNTSTTGIVSPGVPVSGTIEIASDSDWFKQVLEAGKSYQFLLDGITLADPILKLRDSSGLIIDENDDKIPGSNLNSQITFTPTVNGTYFLDVSGFSAGTGTYRLTSDELSAATPPSTPAPSPESAFQIEIDYSGDPAFLGFFTAAAQRWSQIITADVPDFAGVDDLLISVSITDIDGVGGVLGQAGPDLLRPSSLGRLPYTGSTELDAADVASLASRGTLDDVVLHEFGHILGIGTIWDIKGLRSGPNYTGSNAVREYNNLGGFGPTVPLEADGGPGTALSHWSEDVFGDELMTGFLSGLSNPLSKVTVGTLQDLGYTVNYNLADSFSFSSSLLDVDTSSQPPSIDRSSGPRSASPNVSTDALVEGSSPCFCGTCASIARTGFELGQFSDSISRPATRASLVSPVTEYSYPSSTSEFQFGRSVELPPYLITDSFALQRLQDPALLFVPAFMVTDQIAT